MTTITLLASETLSREFSARGMFADAAFERIMQARREIAVLDDSDILNVFLNGCIDRLGREWAYHTLYAAAGE